MKHLKVIPYICNCVVLHIELTTSQKFFTVTFNQMKPKTTRLPNEENLEPQVSLVANFLSKIPKDGWFYDVLSLELFSCFRSQNCLD